jgi:NAD(P)-dependent dehydrogenase (short-subunit alcohol dehydrogenase family)
MEIRHACADAVILEKAAVESREQSGRLVGVFGAAFQPCYVVGGCRKPFQVNPGRLKPMTDNETDVYLISGGTGGIGLEVARRLRQSGRQVVLGARTEARLTESARELCCQSVVVDATNAISVAAALDSALEGGRRLAGLVNCVGSILIKPAHLTTDEEWLTTLHTNLTSSFYLLRESARRMMSTGGGALVFCSTVAAERGLFNHEAIAAAKAGVEGMARAAASTYARYKIRVNCVAPGLVRTPLSRSLTANEAVLKASTAMHPLGRIGEPEDIASAICWLLSPEQTWITGQVLRVDGGMSTVQPR